MTPDGIASDLANRLALGDVTLGAACPVTVYDHAAHGLRASVRPTLEALAAGLMLATLVPAAPGIADDVGIQISAVRGQPGLVAVTHVAPGPARVVSVRAAAECWRPDGADPHTVYVDLERGGGVAVVQSDGTGVVLAPTPDGFVVAPFAPPLPVAELRAVRAPVTDWMALVRDDAWLHARLAAVPADGDWWPSIVAAGMALRLYEPSSAAARAALVDALVHGRQAGPLGAGAAWLASLNDAELESIEDLALAVAERVATALDDLDSAMCPAETWWRRSVRDLCLERDDLDSVLVLLRVVRRGARLDDALQALDAVGSRFAEAIPVALRVDEERLRRARQADPDAWWATIGSP